MPPEENKLIIGGQRSNSRECTTKLFLPSATASAKEMDELFYNTKAKSYVAIQGALVKV